MDPVTMVVAALAAGAGAGMKDTASLAIKDGYAGLKALVLRRVKEQPAGEIAMIEHESDPQTWSGPLTKVLDTAGVEQDRPLLDAAEHLLRLVDPAGYAAGTYTVNITASGDRSVAAHTIHGGVHTGDTQPG